MHDDDRQGRSGGNELILSPGVLGDPNMRGALFGCLTSMIDQNVVGQE